MTSYPTNPLIGLTTPISQMDRLATALATLPTTAAVLSPTNNLANIVTSGARMTATCGGANYVKFMPLFSTSGATNITLSVVGWNRSGIIGTASNQYTYFPTPIASLTITAGTTAVSGTGDTAFGAASMALAQGDAKIYNASGSCLFGYFVVDVLGCEFVSVLGQHAGTTNYVAYVARF